MRSRRELLKQVAGMGVLMPFAGSSVLPFLSAAAQEQHKHPAPAPLQTSLAPEDDQFLEELEKANFLYFWEQGNPQTGLVKDRASTHSQDNRTVASIAATGFGLTALCIAQKRGFVSYPDANARVLATLRFLWKKLPTHRGFFYHWADINSGERVWDSEVSSVDTAILLCGILTCRPWL